MSLSTGKTYHLYQMIPRKHTRKNKIVKAVANYVLTGNLTEAAQKAGVAKATVYVWAREDWWPTAVDFVREQKNTELDAKITAVIDEATNVVEDRLEYGDTIITSDGEERKKPLSARDATYVGATWFDRREKIRNGPEEKKEGEMSIDKIARLAEVFAKIARGDNHPEEKVIEEAEYTECEDV